MNGFIVRRHTGRIEKHLTIVEYEDVPIEASKKTDTGTATVAGRVSIVYVGDFLVIETTPFYISAVSYQRDQDQTVITLSEKILSLDTQKYIKPTVNTVKAVAELNRMTYDLNETYVNQTASGGTISKPSNTFVDPVFKMSYFSIGGEWTNFIQLLQSKSSNIIQISGFKDWGANSFYSLCDVLIALRKGFTVYNSNAGAAESVKYWLSGGLNSVTLETPVADDNHLPTLVCGTNAVLISEEYKEGEYFSLVTSINSGTRRHYARYIENGEIKNPTTTDSFCFSSGYTPIPLEGINPATGNSVQRVTFGKWGNVVSSTQYVAAQFLQAMENYFWRNERGQYSIAFLSERRFHIHDKIRLIIEDDTREVKIESVRISSKYPDMYVYQCGGLAATLSEKVKLLTGGKNGEVVIEE